MSKQTVLVIGNQGFLFACDNDLQVVTACILDARQAEQIYNTELGAYEWHLLDKPKDFRIDFTDIVTKEQ